MRRGDGACVACKSRGVGSVFSVSKAMGEEEKGGESR